MIVFIQGIKGGTGKSVVARFAVDHFQGQNPLVIDTDNANPDVARSYILETSKNSEGENSGKNCTIIGLNISDREGFENLMEQILKAQEQGRPVVINTGARNQVEMTKFGPSLLAMCEAQNFDIVTLWVIDADRFCIEQLHNFTKSMNPRLTIVKNLGLAEEKESRFDFLEDTNIGKSFPSVFFPMLPNSVMKLLKSPERKAVHELEDCMSIAARFLNRPIIEQARTAISKAIEIAAKKATPPPKTAPKTEG